MRGFPVGLLVALLLVSGACRRAPQARDGAATPTFAGPTDGAAEAPTAVDTPEDAAAAAPADRAEPADPVGRWVVRNPGPTRHTLEAIAWVSDTEAWAAGAYGAVVRSTDAGATWAVVPVPRAAYWMAVGVAADGAVWLAGEHGTRLRGTGPGPDWEVVVEPPADVEERGRRWRQPGVSEHAGRVIVDRWRRTWILEGVLQRIDGATLEEVGHPPGWPDAFAWVTEERCWSGGGIFDIVGIPTDDPSLHGHGVRHTGLLRVSDDGGRTWAEDGNDLRERYVRYLVFDGEGHGVAIGGDALVPETNVRVAETDDGGETWEYVGGWEEAEGPAPEGPAEVCVPDEREPRIRCTWDGGRSWFGGVYPGPVPGAEHDPGGRYVAARDLERIVAVGGNGRIYRAEDGAWVSRNAGPVPHLARLAVAGATAIAVGEGVLVSHDAGATWTEVDAPPLEAAPIFASWGTVDVLDERTAWIGSRTGAVFGTSDGGATWTERSDGLPATEIGGEDFDARNPGIALLRFVDAERGLAGTRRRLFATADGGASWVPVELPAPVEETPSLVAVLPGDPDPVVLVSDRRRLWRSADGGRTFAAVGDGLPDPPTYSTIAALVAGREGEAFLLDRVRVLRSENGGAAWTPFGTAPRETPIGAAATAQGTLDVILGTGAVFRVERSAEFVEPSEVVPPIDGAFGAAAVIDAAGRGILVGASGLIATLDSAP